MNPAPREDCIRCDKIVEADHDTFYCELCCLWCHIKCLNITTDQFKAISNVPIPWFCKSCSKLSKGVVSDVNKLKATVTKIKDDLTKINKKVSDEQLEVTINALVAKAVSVALPSAV